MVWVRYDDEFHHHDKVMEARDSDPGSLALHLLGNTWTASSKTPGWIPSYVPRQLVGAKGSKWAQILVASRLWDRAETDGKTGWWVHDFDTYNPVDDATKKRRSESARKAANARWHPGDDAPPHADGMPDACEPDAPDVPPDAIVRGHPVPVPLGSSSGGERPETLRSVPATQPPQGDDETCTRHPGGNPRDEPCGGCKRVEERKAARMARDADTAARARADAARLCQRCDGVWLLDDDKRPTGRKCDHRRSA